MNRLSVMVESSDYLKGQNESETKKPHSGSLSDLTQKSIGREDSILSKSSLSLFFKKSVEGSWSNGSISTSHIPRPDKAQILFDKVLSGLNEMFEKYSQLTTEDGLEHQDYNEICTKIDDRIMLVQTLKADYLKLLEKKGEEYDKIQTNLEYILKNKNNKTVIEMEESESYWNICKELFIIESKLEKCTGKLQFQIMDLDSISKMNSLDQYELSIRLNDATKFKSRIRIEKTGHQLWDMRNFEIYPIVDDYIYIKFAELKPLNKSSVLIEKKLPFVNELIRSSPSIFSIWLTPVGTIKLKVIVQWNAVLGNSNLHSHLLTNEEIPVRSRASSTSHKYGNNKLSLNIENLFRSSRAENNVHSISNIVEDIDEEKKSKETFHKMSTEIKTSEDTAQQTDSNIGYSDKERHPDQIVESVSSVKINVIDETTTNPPLEKLDENPKVDLMKQEEINLSFQEEKFVEDINEEEVKEIKEEEIKKERVESCLATPVILRSPNRKLQNEDDFFETRIIILDETAISGESNEIVVGQETVSHRSTENSSEIPSNEIEVEITMDSSEMESTEQISSDDSCHSNSVVIPIQEASSGSRNLESYTVNSVELSEDSEIAGEEALELATIDSSESRSESTTENVVCNVTNCDASTDNINSDDPTANQE